MNDVIVEKVIEQLKDLPYELQWRVFEFTRALNLSAPRGTSGRSLLSFAGAIPAEDLRIMSRAIEKDCENIDANEW